MSSRKIIHTSKAPSPIGPYSQAVLAGNMLFISGQIALDPNNGELISGDIKAETRQCMENLKAILTKASMGFEQVAKASIFVKDMKQFAEINEVYGSYFDPATAPARETVEVSNLPKFVNVEISMIAIR